MWDNFIFRINKWTKRQLKNVIFLLRFYFNSASWLNRNGGDHLWPISVILLSPENGRRLVLNGQFMAWTWQKICMGLICWLIFYLNLALGRCTITVSLSRFADWRKTLGASFSESIYLLMSTVVIKISSLRLGDFIC